MYKKIKNKSGYTLAEMLLAVSIMIIVMAVVVYGVADAISSHKQRERDDTAEAIYLAAQDELTKLGAAGFLSKVYASDVYRAQNDELKLDDVYYRTNVDQKLQRYILPEGSIDETIRQKYYCIEYNYEEGYIYGVFYSEESFSYSNVANSKCRNIRKERQKQKVGYYGANDNFTVGDRQFNTLKSGAYIENKNIVIVASDNFGETDKSKNHKYDENFSIEAGGGEGVYYLDDIKPGETQKFNITVTSNVEVNKYSTVLLEAFTTGSGPDEEGKYDLDFTYNVKNDDGENQKIYYIDNKKETELNDKFNGPYPIYWFLSTKRQVGGPYKAVYTISVTLDKNSRNSGGTGYFKISIQA